jgi:hypothetical protein
VKPHELFPFPAERTAFSDEFYAALGRAVAFCAHFEQNCTLLATTLKLRVLQQQKGAPPQDVIDRVVEEMAKPRLKRILVPSGRRCGSLRRIRIARFSMTEETLGT